GEGGEAGGGPGGGGELHGGPPSRRPSRTLQAGDAYHRVLPRQRSDHGFSGESRRDHARRERLPQAGLRGSDRRWAARHSLSGSRRRHHSPRDRADTRTRLLHVERVGTTLHAPIQSVGCFRCQPVACWKACAALSILASPNTRPTNVRLVGCPFSLKPCGTTTHGCPVRFVIDVLSVATGFGV